MQSAAAASTSTPADFSQDIYLIREERDYRNFKQITEKCTAKSTFGFTYNLYEFRAPFVDFGEK